MSEHIKGLMHNGRRWDIVRIKGSYFARCYGQGEYAGRPSDTGPYSTMEQAQEFIQAIVPAHVSAVTEPFVKDQAHRERIEKGE